MPLNLPNLLTWFRILLIPLFVAVLYLPSNWLTQHQANATAMWIFIFAALTDWLDGYLARRLNQTSAFGAFLDPVADKLMVAAALIVLVELNRVSAIVALIIIGQKVFGRNSIDNAGMTLMSSVHFGVRYNNAFWNGSQMIYGDGDASIFVDFTMGNDVIGHELTHGVTQHTLQLAYANEAGGLNESMSDCFGSMFRQWEANQDAAHADWLIGADIMGPAAKARGFTCLRDMASPAARHCLAPQPTRYSQIRPGMDPHESSGPPNLAFTTACKTIGGKSWETIGKVWYRSMTGFGPSPNMRMRTFANRTRQVAAQLFPTAPAVAAAVNRGWQQIGL